MTVLDRVPVDRITVEARDLDLGRNLLALVVGVFYVIGWLVGKASVAVSMVWSAAKIGWVDARKPTGDARGRSA